MKSFFIKMEIPLNEDEEMFLNDVLKSGTFKIMGEYYRVDCVSYDFENDSNSISTVTVSGV